MKFRYSTKDGIFETNDFKQIPLNELHSLNDNPAYDELITGYKRWLFEGKVHRETGPAKTWADGTYSFWLNGIYYNNVNDWLIDNPNKEIEFQAFMRLKYT